LRQHNNSSSIGKEGRTAPPTWGEENIKKSGWRNILS
jgi:hypothetical protein